MVTAKIGEYIVTYPKGWEVYRYKSYTEESIGCTFYFIDRKNRVCWYSNGMELKFTLDTTDYNSHLPYTKCDAYQYERWFEDKESPYYDKFILLVPGKIEPETFDETMEDLPWWKVGPKKEDSLEGKTYKTPMTHQDVVRIAQTVRLLRPTITPNMAMFTPYDRGKWEQWQQQVHWFARTCFDNVKKNEDGDSTFDRDEFFEIAGVTNGVFDLAKFKVQGDEVA